MSGVLCTRSLQRGIQGRLADLEPCCRFPDVQPVGDVLPRPLQLVGGDNRLASAFPTACGGGGQSGFGAFADQVAIELAERAELVEDESPARCGGATPG